MDPQDVEALTSFLEDRVGDNLRSVIHYEKASDDYEIVFARDDVLSRYSAETIERLVQSYRWESAGKFVEERRYDHGGLNAIVRSFEEGIEINLMADGEGVAIGRDAGTFVAHNTFVGKCMELAGIESVR